jgi:hypothetical protein
MVEDDILTNSYSIDEEESNRVRLNSGNGPSTVTNAQNFTSAAMSNSLLALPKELGTAGGEVDSRLYCSTFCQKDWPLSARQPLLSCKAAGQRRYAPLRVPKTATLLHSHYR